MMLESSILTQCEVQAEIDLSGEAAGSARGMEDVEQLVERAAALMEQNRFNKAKDIYREITGTYPMDYRGWLGIVIAQTKKMTEINITEYAHGEILKNFHNALKVADETKQELIQDKRQEYETLYKEEVHRREHGKYNASVCNRYDYRDVEQALGCQCLTGEIFTFERFSFVLGNYVECLVSYPGGGFENGEMVEERLYTFIQTTCEKNVDRTNIEKLLTE